MIHIICALQCEASPLIHQLQLHHHAQSTSFPLYIDRQRQTSLTISNTGKINAAAATAFTHAFLQTSKHDIWINIGIAGHSTLAIGDLVLGHKITDQATQHVWYPQLIPPIPCHTTEIFSYDKPSTNYTDAASEMEAAGFYATASRFATSELIHVIKIISDNPAHPISKIEKSMVTDLIEQQIDMIEQLLHIFTDLAKHLDTPIPPTQHYDQITAQWHFTQAQQDILKTHLHRWLIICPNDPPLAAIKSANNAANVLNMLVDKLDSYPLSLHTP